MHLVHILLPLFDNAGAPMPEKLFSAVRAELLERFGGVTAYTRAPARGLWKEDDANVQRDEVVLYEVMADDLDRAWWARYRATLERRLAQEEVVIRAQPMERL